MARVALPESKVRARRRRRRAVGGIFAALAVVAMLGGFVWLSHAPFLRVERVVAAGLASVSATDVEAVVRKHLEGTYAFLFAKNNILIYPQDTIAATLRSEYPQFKVVEVRAQDFSTINVVVVEREPKSLWCPEGESARTGGCYFMDEDGVVYARAGASDALYIEYRGTTTEGALPRQYLGVEAFRALSAFVGAVAQKETTEPPRTVAVDAVSDVRIGFPSGFVLLFSAKAQGGDVFERYALARDAAPFAGRALGEFEYLDLRFGDKLYYKERHE